MVGTKALETLWQQLLQLQEQLEEGRELLTGMREKDEPLKIS